MDNDFLEQLASQLRKPNGEMGKKVGENMNTSNALMNTSTIDEIDVKSGAQVLEIGMGNGFFIKDVLAKESSITYYGCDYSELMIEEASVINRTYIETGQVKLFHTTADKLPFQNNSLDVVFTINTIYFWNNPTVELTEIHRVLKRKGKLFLTVRSKASMENIPVTQFGFKIYDQQMLTDLLHTAGFEVDRIVEKDEPDMEFNGTKVKLTTWIVCAQTV
jgi:ubiquinone/menaquinone biosynthesis C-methylase UbiE